jgi:hypothetical protein
VDPSGIALAATLDLRGRTRGLWDLVVTPPGGDPIVQMEAFLIEEGTTPDVWVDIVGFGLIRPERSQAFHVFYGNGGNVDVHALPLWIAGIPPDASVELVSERDTLVLTGQEGFDWTPASGPIVTTSEQALSLILPGVAAGETGAIQLRITVPGACPAPGFVLRAWTNPPLRSGALSPDFSGCVSAATQPYADLGPYSDCHVETWGVVTESWQGLSLPGARPFLFGQVWTSVATQCSGNSLPLADLVAQVEAILASFAAPGKLAGPCAAAMRPVRTAQLPVAVVCSFGPNDKLGPRGAGEPRWISAIEPLRYTIRFKNAEEASAPAQEVIITDDLDESVFDLGSLSLGPITFGEHVIVPPVGSTSFSGEVDLRPGLELVVQVAASLNPVSGVVVWSLRSVDPTTGDLPADPSLGFLPANMSPPEGEGSVSLTVSPLESLAEGTTLANSASIEFDANPALLTPPWTNVLDASAPESVVLPLPPAQVSREFRVSWSGVDLGSGVGSYSIYVSEDAGPFLLWLSDTPDTTALFRGRPGRVYSFYSRARDEAGNLEQVPLFADATTEVRQSARTRRR